MPPSTYGLDEPTETHALDAFGRVLGEAEARVVWDRACVAAGFPMPRAPLTRSQLRTVAELLARQEGFVGVMGASLRIRIETYETLSDSWGTTPSSDDEPHA